MDLKPQTKHQNKVKNNSYSLEICEVCDLPFNDYNDGGVCDNCSDRSEHTKSGALKQLRIKLGWLALYRAIIKNEDSATARRLILEMASQKSGYKLSRLLKKVA